MAEKNKAAQSLAKKRWDNSSDAEKREANKKMLNARWGNHVAKRPASSRKKTTASTVKTTKKRST